MAANDHVAQRKKTDDGRNHKKRDLPQAGVHARAKDGRDFVGGTERAAHQRKFRSGDGHAEQADGQRVERLRVGQRGNGAGRQPTGKKRVNVRADLHHAAANENWEKNCG